MGYTSAVRKCIHIEIRTRFNLIHEREWTGGQYLIFVSDTAHQKDYYKWNNRYKQKGIEGLIRQSLKDLIISSTRR